MTEPEDRGTQSDSPPEPADEQRENRTRFAQPGGRTRFSVPPATGPALDSSGPPPPPAAPDAPPEPVAPAGPEVAIGPPGRSQDAGPPSPQHDEHGSSQASQPVAADDTRAGDQDALPAPRPRRSARLILAGLGALALVLAVLGAFLGQALSGSGDQEVRRQQALDAARDDVRTILAYDYRHLDQDYAAARAVITGPLRKEYDSTAATTKMSADRVALKASLASEVLNAAIETSSGDRATALVFVNRAVRGTVFATPQVTLDRIEMTLVRQRGTWVVEKLQMR